MSRSGFGLGLAFLVAVVVVGLLGAGEGAILGGEEPGAPRVVAAWAAGPLEARVGFDRAIEGSFLEEVAGQTVEFGGEQQKGTLRVAAARLEDEGRTLVLYVDAHPWETRYRVVLPGLKSAAGLRGGGEEVAVEYGLNGVEAKWFEGEAASVWDDEAAWTTWWPHLEPARARELAGGSVEQERSFEGLTRVGVLSLRALLAAPEGASRLVLTSDRAFEAGLYGELVEAEEVEEGAGYRVSLELDEVEPGFPTEALVVLPTRAGEGLPGLKARLEVAGELREVGAESLVVPWSPGPAPAGSGQGGGAGTEVAASLYEGGDAGRGEAVFFSEEAKCSTCHRVGEKGGVIGPAVSEMRQREGLALYRSILEPSAEIHPEYATFTVAFVDGRVAVGVVKAEGADQIKVLDTNAKATVYRRDEVERIEPSRTSIMPVGLAGAIGEERMRDLVAYLRLQDPAAAGRGEAVKP